MNRLWCKLIFKCFMVTLPFWLLWISVWVIPVSHYTQDSVYFEWNKKFINTAHAKKYDTIIIGDSLANSAFIPNYLSENTVNLSLSTATPFTVYYILDTYLKNNQKPKTCYIIFADHHMNDINGLYELTFYSHNLSFAQEMELFRYAKFFKEKSVLKDGWFIEWLSYKVGLPNKYICAIRENGFFKNKEYKEKIHLNDIHKGSYQSRTLYESKYHELETWDEYVVKPLFDFYYKKILDLCKQKGINVRIVILPKGSWIHTTDNYKLTMKNYYHNLISQFPNVTYIDSISDFKRYNFSDHHHLNLRGGLKFTREIKKLYPQDFVDSGEKSAETIEGMEDYLCYENAVADIVNRIADTNFSALLIFKPKTNEVDKELISVLKEYYKNNKSSVSFLNNTGSGDSKVIYIDGLTRKVSIFDDEKKFITMKKSDNKLYIDVPMWLNKHFEFNSKQKNGESQIILLNNYDKKILFVKDFSFIKEKYKILPY